MKSSTKWIIGLGVSGIIAYFLFKPEKAEASVTNNTPQSLPLPTIDELRNSSATTQQTIEKRKGILEVVIELRASGIEKALVNRTDLYNDILKAAKRIGSTLPTECPGAPVLVGNPSVILGDTSNGFKVTINWPALWKGTNTGPTKAIVRDCITRLVKQSDGKINDRFISLTSRRANAYA